MSNYLFKHTLFKLSSKKMILFRLIIFIILCSTLASAAPFLDTIFPHKVQQKDKAALLDHEKIQLWDRKNKIENSQGIIASYHDQNSPGTNSHKKNILDRQKSVKRIEGNISALQSNGKVTYTRKSRTSTKTFKAH